jgi:hypothetical protein
MCERAERDVELRATNFIFWSCNHADGECPSASEL